MQQIAEIELKYTPKYWHDGNKLTTPFEVAEFIKSTYNPDTIELREEFKIILLNNSNKILGVFNAFIGGLGSCRVDIKLILSTALKANASGLIATHNHPSGKMEPSLADVKVTEEIKKGCEAVGLRMVDHLIISTQKYYSFEAQTDFNF